MDKKRILVFGASNSKQSINKEFAIFVANQLAEVDLEIVDLNDFDLPIYSLDLQRASGIPTNAIRFAEHIEQCDAIVASFAEHNGLFTTVFKNLWDWMSRIETQQIWKGKPMFLLCASPSRRTEKYVLKAAKDLFPHYGATIVAEFYLRSFKQAFADGQIIDPELKQAFAVELQRFQSYLDRN